MNNLNRRPRGTLPDAVNNNAIYLIKATSILHATYQVRMLTFMARKEGKQLVLLLNAKCLLHECLLSWLRNLEPDLVRIERAK